MPRRKNVEDEEKAAQLDAEAICQTAAHLVGGPRARTHGAKTMSFGVTAALWTAYTKAKMIAGRSHVTTAEDAANMLELFKVGRRLCGAYNPDDYIDGAGYAGCAGEIAEKVHRLVSLSPQLNNEPEFVPVKRRRKR